jgi:hypothetical protein
MASDASRQDQRIDKIEVKIENLAKAVEAIHRAMADARPATATLSVPYMGATR